MSLMIPFEILGPQLSQYPSFSLDHLHHFISDFLIFHASVFGKPWCYLRFQPIYRAVLRLRFDYNALWEYRYCIRNGYILMYPNDSAPLSDQRGPSDIQRMVLFPTPMIERWTFCGTPTARKIDHGRFGNYNISIPITDKSMLLSAIRPNSTPKTLVYQTCSTSIEHPSGMPSVSYYPCAALNVAANEAK